jgi:hypothetical protein
VIDDRVAVRSVYSMPSNLPSRRVDFDHLLTVLTSVETMHTIHELPPTFTFLWSFSSPSYRS